MENLFSEPVSCDICRVAVISSTKYLKGGGCLEDLNVDGNIILKWT